MFQEGYQSATIIFLNLYEVTFSKIFFPNNRLFNGSFTTVKQVFDSSIWSDLQCVPAKVSTCWQVPTIAAARLLTPTICCAHTALARPRSATCMQSLHTLLAGSYADMLLSWPTQQGYC